MLNPNTESLRGHCSTCDQLVILVDFNIDPESASHVIEHYSCIDHKGKDGRHCDGSGQIPRKIPELEDNDHLPMEDGNPFDSADNYE
jgi:hypothetical protein